jgi:serine/threonine-protein kinase RsbT
MSALDYPAREVQVILERHLSPIMARGFFERCLRQLDTATLEPKHLAPFIAQASRMLKLFLEPDEAERALAELRALQRATAIELRSRVDVTKMEDIVTARVMARKHCDRARASPLVSMCAITVAGELARNIARHSRGGHLEFRVEPSRIFIIAIDSGPGIENLDQLLEGGHQDKTGPGRGLLAVKEAASYFDVKTSPSGTRVEAVVAL